MKDKHLPEQFIASKIYEIRKHKVMLDADLAELYGVETRVLNQAVKRNEGRFPVDFKFTLSQKEWDDLKSQNVISSWGGRRKLPRVFTEQGVAMLSSVLNSETAIAVNIQIIRVFTKIREVLLTRKDLLLEIEEIKKKVSSQDEKIELVFSYLKQFIQEQSIPRKSIGYKTNSNKDD